MFADCLKEQFLKLQAEVAHLVERDLAKVEVAGSSPVFRSEKTPAPNGSFLFLPFLWRRFG